MLPMNRGNKEKSKDTGKVEEPVAAYNVPMDKTVRFFSSFEEMNVYDIQDMADRTPSERLRNITFMLQNLFSEELQKPFDFTLHFE